jgi:hypothetical protein
VVASVHAAGEGWDVHLENKSSHKLTNVQLAIEDRLLNLGALGPEETKTERILRRDGTPLKTFVANYGANFPNAVSSRQRAIGSTASGQIADKPDSAIAVSFISQLSRSQMYQNTFVATPGLELSPVLEHGGAVLLAWAEGYAPIKPIEQFSPRRSQRDTLWRLALKVE